MFGELIAAVVIGLTSSVHCIFMCGGLVSALQPTEIKGIKLFIIPVLFGVGRLLSYAIIGFIFGVLVITLDNFLAVGIWLRIIAGILLIAMGLYLSNIWRGLTVLEKTMLPVWRPIGQYAKRFLPIRHYSSALVVGMLWGWIPCGLIYSSVLWASTTSSTPFEASTLMFAMGVGTLPAMLGLSVMTSVLKGVWLKRFGSLFLCVFGVWTLYTPVMSLTGSANHHEHHQPQHHNHQPVDHQHTHGHH